MDEVDRGAFLNWLLNEKTGRQSCMIGRAHGEKIIQYLREKKERGDGDVALKSKFTAQFRVSVKKRNFKLLNAVGLGDILCLPVRKAGKKNKDSHAMLGQNRQVIFKEDMYDVIHNAHKMGQKHRGYKGTFNKINETYCSIPREVVYKYVELCSFCVVNHARFTPNSQRKDIKGKAVKCGKTKRKFEFPDAFLTRCQLAIMDMTKSPDGQFQYIGHFLDHHTKYNVLFPMKIKDAKYVAQKLCRHVFSHFGLPRILYNADRKYLNELIGWILHIWSSDAQIISGDPQNDKMVPFLNQRQRTIIILIETIRSKQGNTNNWVSLLPGIQYSLNTNEFEQDSPPSYDVVYKTRTRCYTYSASCKEVLHEEDISNDAEDIQGVAENQESRTALEVAPALVDNEVSPALIHQTTEVSHIVFSQANSENMLDLSMAGSDSAIRPVILPTHIKALMRSTYQ